MALIIFATTCVVIVVFGKLRSQWPPPKYRLHSVRTPNRKAAPSGIEVSGPEAQGDRRVNEAVDTVAKHFSQLADNSRPRAVISLVSITRRIARGTDAWRSVEAELIRRAGGHGYLLEVRDGRNGPEAVLMRIQDGWANEVAKM